ncbi:hypothetical protein GGS23DRAFT_597236 [Durotheca rogersii]|uniref:uncharacterized protein n=1 Tax=Durotheca rogersii TaxID=419775 RepID=UPI00221ECB96|nr:uncharacterized protein GGS23DRAFT_597236 [Durotheca rogersii]KAI5862932.1 hypothetical protein GGS23DRAFT_597236 [Durotheca rogersii]
MDSTISPEQSQRLDAFEKIPIADLNPDLSNPASRTVRGVVTITWPYNSVQKTFSFILAEPDYRLRRNKGQVRISFSGASAKAAGDSGLSSGDEILVSLDGAEWEPEQTRKRQSLPGASIDWHLKFAEKLLLQVTVSETRETQLIIVRHNPSIETAVPQQPVEASPAETNHAEVSPVLDLEPLTPLSKPRIEELKDGEFSSPAFIKRARMSYGSLFEDGYDIFEEDGGVKGRGRKRSRFGRESGAWKYTSQSPSPELASPPGDDVVLPPAPEMTDEGCQTMELDFAMPLSAPPATHPDEVRKSPKLAIGEEQSAALRGDMVDHGVQRDLHGAWLIPTPASLPPFLSGPAPSTGSELPAFEPGTAYVHTNDFPGEWNPRPVDLPIEGYGHNLPVPLEDYPANEYGVVRARTPLRSPHSPHNITVEHSEHVPGGDHPVEEPHYPILEAPENTAYPPLDIGDEERNHQLPHDTHLDYPPSYLGESQHFSHLDSIVSKQDTTGSRTLLPAKAGSSSWATINNGPHVTSELHSDQPESAEGRSPEIPVVINESDSDGEEPPLVASNEVVMSDRADGNSIQDEAEIENEADARFSDDEAEHDEDEIGDDYDIRNYTGPDDDEDDSHDEDLRPHKPEPEFDDGESWSEEDEEQEESDWESGYEVDNRLTNPQPPPKLVQSEPQVIDLISSDEESEEDEATAPQPEHGEVPSNSLGSEQKLMLGPMPDRRLIIDVGSESDEEMAEEDEEVPGEEDDGDIEEEELLDEYDDDDEEEEELRGENSDSEGQDGPKWTHPPVGREPETFAAENENARLPLEQSSVGEEVSKVEDPRKVLVAASLQQPKSPKSSDANELSKDSRNSPEPDEPRSTATRAEDEDNTVAGEGAEKGEGNFAPNSAAEGLEILSRIVEGELNVEVAPPVGPTSGVDLDITMPEAGGISVDRAKQLEETVENDSQDIQGDEEPIDMVPTFPHATWNIPPTIPAEGERAQVVGPASPPFTDSFRSQLSEGKTEAVLEETVTAKPQIPSAFDQLTPQNTQLPGNGTVADNVTSALMDVDEPDEIDNTAESAEIVHVPSSTTEQTPSTEQVSTAITAPELAVEKPVEYDAQQQRTALERDVYGVSSPGRVSSPDRVPVSPSLSFQTQVDAGEFTQISFVDSIPGVEVGAEAANEAKSDFEAGVPDVSPSFRSQMEIDEELQASIIMEYADESDEGTDVDTERDNEADGQLEDRSDESDEEDDEVDMVPEKQSFAANPPRPDLGLREEQLAEPPRPISTAIPTDVGDQVLLEDPSIRLARAANVAKQTPEQNEVTSMVHPDPKLFPVHESSSPGAEDASVRLSRSSLSRHSQAEEEDSRMTTAKLRLVRYLRDELPDCSSLRTIQRHLQMKLETIAVAVMRPPDPRRAKGGPREYMMSFTITDHSIGPYEVVEVQLYRPHKERLPIVKTGDVVLLRNFTVVALHNKGFGLRTNDESSWAIFDYEGEPAQIKGPPVEYGERETTYVTHMRAWFHLLDEKARAKLEDANKKIVEAGGSK